MVASLPASKSVAQQALYLKTYKDVTAHVEADESFAKVKGAIESHLGLLQKQAQVKVRNWLKKLSEETSNVVWKKNRNAYARLLLEQLRCGKLAEPFSTQPPNGPLPTLPKHAVYAFRPARSGSPSAAAAQAHSGAALQPGPPPQQQQQQQLTATQQLDDYLGRADFRRAQFAEEQATAAAEAAADSGEAGLGLPAAPVHYLPGTRMQLRGAEALRVDRHQLNDVGWQPSKLELEAQLGASRERQAELEWRLAQMEHLVRQHAAMLQAGGSGDGVWPGLGAGVAPPLGSLLDAIDDGHVSPPRQPRPGKQELEALIERYEAKRRQWQSPSWAGGGGGAGRPAASSGRAGPPLVHSDEAEILEQLENFQRQTEAIRRQLGAGGSGGSGSAVGSDGFGGLPPAVSSLAVNTSAGSEWGLHEGTPLRQQPTGLLGGGGYTPRGPSNGGRMQQVAARPQVSLFEGLPPSPAALACYDRPAAPAATAGGGSGAGGYNRHVEHAGHFEHSGFQQQQQGQQAQQMQQLQSRPAPGPGSSRLGGGAAAERPRSPIGPDIRHTKKSAAAAEKAGGTASAMAALQQLKSSRHPAAAVEEAGGAVAGTGAEAAQRHSQAQASRHRQHGSPSRAAEGRQQPHAAEESWRAARHAPEGSCQAGQQGQAEALSPPELPPDSNAALVAEVRQLRSRLLASLHKHAPELVDNSTSVTGLGGDGGSSSAGAGALGSSSSSSSFLSAAKLAEQQRQEGQPSGGLSSSWRLAAVPAARVTSGSFKQQRELAGRGSSGDGFGGSSSSSLLWAGEPAASQATSALRSASAAAVAVVAASSNKSRQSTDDSGSYILGGGRHQLKANLGSGDGLADFSGPALSGGWTPTALGAGDGGLNGGASLAQLSNATVTTSAARLSDSFSLEAFEAQTEALRRQLAGM